MLHVPTTKLVNRRSPIQRRTVQLGGGLLLAFVLPWASRLAFMSDPTENLLIVSGLGNLVAVVLGYYIFRSLTSYPGIRMGLYVLPTFAVSYGIVLLSILALRLDYSRFVLLTGFILCCIWFMLVFLLVRRARSMAIGVVPFGQTDSLLSIPGANWVLLKEPSRDARRGCEGLVADFRTDLPDEWDRFLADAALASIPVYHVKQLRESLSGRVEIEHLSENTFGSLIPNSAYMDIKRSADLISALVVGAITCFPLMLCALAIRLESPGPALFTQYRVGRAGVPFKIYKLRTMYSDHRGSASRDDRTHAITRDRDERVTPLGRFFRRTRIDELPQIINIIRGEMSWIGPRPEADVLSDWYEAELPFYRYRHIVQPGITGWAQIHQGHVADMENVLGKLQYDFYYIKYFSFWLDFLIVMGTIKTVFSGFGSR